MRVRAGLLFVAVGCVGPLVPSITGANIIIDVTESAGDVVFNYSGSIDLTGLRVPTDPSGASSISLIAPPAWRD
jgi:hypothetical protein